MKRLAYTLAATAAITCARAEFLRAMPKTTNERPTNPQYEELAETFRSPGDKAPIGVYWYWMAGNVSKEGVQRDLEAMKKAGINRAYIGDIGGGGNKNGPVKTFSKEWEEALQAAFAKASELGISLGLFNSPGWSQSGGPWIKPEMAMRRFVQSFAVVEGPQKDVTLPQPAFEYSRREDYRDLFLLAYPLPKDFAKKLEVKDINDALLLVEGKKLVAELNSAEPFAAQSAVLAFIDGGATGSVRVEADDNGKWKTVANENFARKNHRNGTTFAPHSPIILSFPQTVSRKFRVTVSAKPRDRARFSTISIHAAPLISKAAEKSLAKLHETPLPMWGQYLWQKEDSGVDGTSLNPAKAIRIDGTKWDAPEGDWLVMRFGCAPTGACNGPANREATGYETDKMSKAHIASHFDAYVGKILERTPANSRKAIRHSVLDSYEVGGQNYTDDFAAKFKSSFGYDPTPYLPTLFGVPVGNRDDSDRFLWDLRRFVADQVAHSYVAGLREASNAHGMGTWLECYGHWGFPGEFLQYGGQSDEIGGEFWSEGTLGDIENRAASSCAHTYGKRLVWAESNTCGGKPFGRAPCDLKQRTDRFFAEGINATLLHVYIHQPDERKPGFTAWFGNEFNRHNTWFGQMDILTGYLKRSNYLLQQGLNVADIAYFIGEDAPKMTGLAEPKPPAGRQFDYINAEVLRETASVDEHGRIVLPHGTAYEVLVLPPLTTMRPEMLSTIEKLVNAGAFVLGPKPERSPSLAGQPQADENVRTIAARLWGEVDGKTIRHRSVGKGTIAWHLPLEEVFAMRQSQADCDVGTLPLAWCHRTMPNAEIYFLSNQSAKDVSGNVSFRTVGRMPEFWQATTGEIRNVDDWKVQNGRTGIEVKLAPRESVFVVFAKSGRAETKVPTERIAVPVNGEWTLDFASQKTVRRNMLEDLSKDADPDIRHYSGTVVYHTKFNAKKAAGRVVLSFGGVREIGRVKVNGKEAGGIWTSPYEVLVGDLLQDGENTLEVEVATSLVNRLVGDASLPEAERKTWLSVGKYAPNSPLRPAGLVGPVELVFEKH